MINIGHDSDAARSNSKRGSSRQPKRKASSGNPRNHPRLNANPNTNQRVRTFGNGLETR